MTEEDFCDHDGARRLKTRIENYWRDRGQSVTVTLKEVGFHPSLRSSRYDIRSDMLNGAPRTLFV